MDTFNFFYNKLPREYRIKLKHMFPEEFLRWHAHHKTDYYLISYPKCGRTWLRLMMGHAIANYFNIPPSEEILFLQWNYRTHPDLPRIKVIHEDRPMLKRPDELATTKTSFKDKAVIFLVRDPRDVIVSSYFEEKHRRALFGDNPYEKVRSKFHGELVDFINQQSGGFDTIIAFYNIWAKNRKIPKDFLLIRYEDIHANPAGELKRILDFIGLNNIGNEEIKAAVNFASFDNMRRMEKETRFDSAILKPAENSKLDTYKTRKGKMGGYKGYLTEEEIETLNQKMRENLSEFYGYNL
jgi:hypothetical protein